MPSQRTPTRRPSRTAFVPGAVFRAVFKTAVPIFSATVLPACLAVNTFHYQDAGGGSDSSRDQVPDVADTGTDGEDERDGAEADAPDGQLGGPDGAGG